ncbi:dipicolinate synthase subunit A [Natronobacillus azotifigens]|uniref:Dipicolinic acid synthetase subunit A n=1 Tax=Natronobacillus azotifigens TaxID=472978 RepID=A0A9J6RAL8_9BACI|nr:dipicolinic acid synthetase subunit A [Natronobacillus azotifigens]MCZ0702613.1 dipicolinic acid synthetase subunit A [Natronobacillus azotifigens]
MKNKIRIAILGGDARYLEMTKKLAENNHFELEVVGFDQLNEGFFGVKQTDLEDLSVEELDAVILPVTGIDEDGKINAVFSNQKIHLSTDWFERLSKHVVMFTGISTPYLAEQIATHGLKLIPLMNRDDVAIYNAVPTTEGAIMLAIQHTNFTIHDANVFVLGLGRVGMTVANKFNGLGANVFVGARKASDLARVNEMGLNGFHLDEITTYTESCDILINTIPASIVTSDVLKTIKSNALIIDLASKPGGVDFAYAKKRGITAIHALGLPGRVAPKTAGEILAKVINQCIL